MTGRPDHLTDRPDRPELARMMDPLSALIGSVRLTGGVFLDARFSAPWCVTSQITAEDCRPFMAMPAHIVAYHVVTKGRLLLVLEGGHGPLEVNGGEIVLLPRNDHHTLATASGLQAVRADDLIQSAPEGGLARIVHGGGGEVTHLVCGFLGSEEAHNPLRSMCRVGHRLQALRVAVRGGRACLYGDIAALGERVGGKPHRRLDPVA